MNAAFFSHSPLSAQPAHEASVSKYVSAAHAALHVAHMYAGLRMHSPFLAQSAQLAASTVSPAATARVAAIASARSALAEDNIGIVVDAKSVSPGRRGVNDEL